MWLGASMFTLNPHLVSSGQEQTVGHFMYTMPKNYFIREQDTYTIPKRSFDRELESIYSSHQPKSSIKSFLEWGCTKNILKYMFVWPLWRGGAEKMTCAQLTARPLATSAYITPPNLWKIIIPRSPCHARITTDILAEKQFLTQCKLYEYCIYHLVVLS